MTNNENFSVDNIQLDQENKEFLKAIKLVEHTGQIIYLTGKAGTGKTTFLKYLRKTTKKKIAIVAPTGVAAINAKGVTIHSFFKIPFSPFSPNDQRLCRKSLIINQETGEKSANIYDTFRYNEDRLKIMRELELLVIDEISMVRCDLLDVIDNLLRTFRNKHYIPFGGVQVVLIGDTFQLPPVVMNNEWKILSQFYKTPFFFSAKIVEEAIRVNQWGHIELKKIYRQNEKEFIGLLNRIRINQMDSSDFKILKQKHEPTFNAKENENYIYLASHNAIVNSTNLTKLNSLTSELFEFHANITGQFPDNRKPSEDLLKLKEGAQVMFIKNDTGESKRYYNGKIAKIVSLSNDEIIAEFDDSEKSQITVERAEWENIEYRWNKELKKIEEVVLGTFEQFPIKLAWAITVHKSQGLTFEKVYADLANCFSSGQVYVALSRCTTFSGLKLKTEIPPSAIITDPRVMEFAKTKTPDTLIDNFLNSGMADRKYEEARNALNAGSFGIAFEKLQEALKLRNDLNTDTFKRYIIVYLNRIKGSTSPIQYKKLQKRILENKALKLSLDLQNDEIIAQKEENEFLAQSNKELKIKNEEFKEHINYLHSEANNLYDKIDEQYRKIKELENLKWYQRFKK
ncbi:DEAD/DEAH box helicase [Pseudozobellia sp. WGM2]|uniref:DEAD/DEAH box helicase n=1 Tax=Pseudozobellia sp. WGM2 TaxID=2787625 RepID=UPI001AE06F7C|nr:DEAD/DEAH box helicase [Pseudozobellia sp. WGM2]